MNDRKSKWINSLLIFYVIYCSGTPVATFYYKYFTVINCALGLFLLLLQIKVDKRSMGAITLVTFFIVIAQIINFDSDFSTPIAILFICIFGYSISQLISIDDFKRTFTNIMVIISVCATAVYIVVRLFPGIVLKLPIFSGTSLYPHILYILFLPAMSHIYPSTLVRNEAMFCEMGIYACMLIFAIIMLMDIGDKSFRLQVVILLIGLVTTFSTTGFLAVFFLLPELYYKFFRGYRFNAFIFGLLIVIGYIKSNTILGILFSKFNSNSGDYGSFTIRFQGTISDVQLFLGNPLGNGVTKYMSRGVGSANTVTYMTAVFGIGCSIIVIGGVLFYFANGKKNIFKLMRMVAVVICLFTQGMTTYPLLYLMAFYGYKRENRRRNVYENSNDKLCKW
mgnify:CR=1 FL=1